MHQVSKNYITIDYPCLTKKQWKPQVYKKNKNNNKIDDNGSYRSELKLSVLPEGPAPCQQNHMI